MALADCCVKNVVTVSPKATAGEVARIMKERNVGSIIVTYNRKPVGIITDRDLILRVMAEGKQPEQVQAETVMTRDLATLKGDMGIFEAIESITRKGVRRMPIVGPDGTLLGIITLDDVIRMIGREMSGVAAIIEQEGPTPQPHR